jgi:hypothetical protein
VTVTEFQRCAKQWQALLRLNDWNITFELVDWLECYGITKWDKYKNAVVQLCTPGTISPQNIGPDDLEITLVHELLHLHGRLITKTIEQESEVDDSFEEMIDLTAQTLVSLKRTLQAKGKPKNKTKKNVKNSPSRQLLSPVKDIRGEDSGKAGNSQAASRPSQTVRTNKFVRHKS